MNRSWNQLRTEAAHAIILSLGYHNMAIDLLEREGQDKTVETAPGYTHVATDIEDRSWRMVTYGGNWYFMYTDWDEPIIIPYRVEFMGKLMVEIEFQKKRQRRLLRVYSETRNMFRASQLVAEYWSSVSHEMLCQKRLDQLLRAEGVDA